MVVVVEQVVVVVGQVESGDGDEAICRFCVIVFVCLFVPLLNFADSQSKAEGSNRCSIIRRLCMQLVKVKAATTVCTMWNGKKWKYETATGTNINHNTKHNLKSHPDDDGGT